MNKKKKKKINPRNAMITEVEHRKRLHGASEILVHRCMMILFRVLADKEGYSKKRSRTNIRRGRGAE